MSKEYPRVPAAFINAIAEEGTKAEAVERLHKYWNETCALNAEIARMRAVLEASASWIERWAEHAGGCHGGLKCTCGRTAILFDARAVLDNQQSE